jgi:hypothetical protein
MTPTSPAREVEFEPVYQHYGPPALACHRSFLTSVSSVAARFRGRHEPGNHAWRQHIDVLRADVADPFGSGGTFPLSSGHPNTSLADFRGRS